MARLGIQAHPTGHGHIGRSPCLSPNQQRSSHSPLIHLNQEDYLPLLKRLHQGVYSVSQKDLPLGDYFSLLQHLKEETYLTPLKYIQSKEQHSCNPHSPPLPRRLSRLTSSGLPQRRQSRHSSHQMASWSQRSHRTPAAIKGHRHFSYGGTVPPENVTIQQFYDLTPTKKSNVRLNDQLMPKPSDINLAEKMIKVPIPKEHPYQSHISRFAMFPKFRSPDDPDTGVRAASQHPLDPLIPSNATDVTLLNKTKGGPYRHEILEVPIITRKKSMAWPGQHGFQDHIKPLKGEGQVFYPKAQKTVFPNSTLRDWDITLSQRTANMLRNVEKSHWITSYQRHFTGTGPTNPLRLDDFHEKTIDMVTGKMTPYTAPLRERSHPVLVPPKPRDGRKARLRQGRRALESSYRPPVTPHAEPPHSDWTSTHNPGCQWNMAAPELLEHRPTQDSIIPQEIISSHEEPSLLRPEPEDVFGPAPVSEDVLFNPHLQDKGSQCETCGGGDCKCQVRKFHTGATEPQRISQATRATLGTVEKITDTERSLALYRRQLPLSLQETEATRDNTQRELCYEDVPSSKKQAYTAGGNPFSLSQPALAEIERPLRHALEPEWQDREIPRSISNPCIQSRPSALSSTHPGGEGGGVPLGQCRSALLELQDSFSNTEVHRRFHSSLQGATVDLRDHVHTGRKHHFYGFNSYYFHN